MRQKMMETFEVTDRYAELRAADPHGRRSSYEIENQVEAEDIVADIEIASDFQELQIATLRLARHLTGVQ